MLSFIFCTFFLFFTLCLNYIYNLFCFILFALLLPILENNNILTFVISLLIFYFYINIRKTLIYIKIIKNKNFNNFLELISYVFLLFLLFKRGSLIYGFFLMKPGLIKVAKALIVALTTKEVFYNATNYLSERDLRDERFREESKRLKHERDEDSKDNHHRRVEESLDSENKRTVVSVVKEINKSQPKIEKKGWNISDSFNFYNNSPKKK